MEGSSPCVVANVLDCGFEVSEFELQSRYYVHFWTNTLRKGMNPLITLLFGEVGRAFTNGPGERGSLPGRVIPKT